jgi:hypothetical protein
MSLKPSASKIEPEHSGISEDDPSVPKALLEEDSDEDFPENSEALLSDDDYNDVSKLFDIIKQNETEAKKHGTTKWHFTVRKRPRIVIVTEQQLSAWWGAIFDHLNNEFLHLQDDDFLGIELDTNVIGATGTTTFTHPVYLPFRKWSDFKVDLLIDMVDRVCQSSKNFFAIDRPFDLIVTTVRNGLQKK